MAAKKTAPSPAQSVKKGRKAVETKGAGHDRPPRVEAPPQKLSALDAAARVLGETKQALSCAQLIEKMAAQGYWTSPAGKTPQATLYAAILREIRVKGEQARFRKTAPGQFALA
jgi:hypothetical protein